LGGYTNTNGGAGLGESGGTKVKNNKGGKDIKQMPKGSLLKKDFFNWEIQTKDSCLYQKKHTITGRGDAIGSPTGSRTSRGTSQGGRDQNDQKRIKQDEKNPKKGAGHGKMTNQTQGRNQELGGSGGGKD